MFYATSGTFHTFFNKILLNISSDGFGVSFPVVPNLWVTMFSPTTFGVISYPKWSKLDSNLQFFQ